MTQPGFRGIQEIGYGRTGQVITCWPEYGGAVVDPTSATISILRPGENEDSTLQVDAVAATEAASYQLSYTLNASDTSIWYLGVGYRALFRYTVSSVPRQTIVAFDVVRVPLTQAPPCNSTDVTNGNASVEDAMKQESLTVDGTTTGAADASRFIVEAWGEIVSVLRARGSLPSRISSPEMLTPWVRAKARIKLYTALLAGGSDVFKDLIPIERQSEEDALSSLAMYYDDYDSGDAKPKMNFTQPRFAAVRDWRRER